MQQSEREERKRATRGAAAWPLANPPRCCRTRNLARRGSVSPAAGLWLSDANVPK